VSFLLALLPWWIWALVILAVIALAATGLLPAVMLLVKKVPLSVWIGIAAVVCGLGWFHSAGEVVAEQDACKAREQAANDKAAADLKAVQGKLDATTLTANANDKTLRAEIARLQGQRTQDRVASDRERAANVTAKAVAMCSLTRGVIVQFNADASRANGQPQAADHATPGAGQVSADTPSGVSLDTYSRAVGAVQSALGVCRDQVNGWQDYYNKLLKPWLASTVEAIMKGSQ
jgi:hypothetical protein